MQCLLSLMLFIDFFTYYLLLFAFAFHITYALIRDGAIIDIDFACRCFRHAATLTLSIFTLLSLSCWRYALMLLLILMMLIIYFHTLMLIISLPFIDDADYADADIYWWLPLLRHWFSLPLWLIFDAAIFAIIYDILIRHAAAIISPAFLISLYFLLFDCRFRRHFHGFHYLLFIMPLYFRRHIHAADAFHYFRHWLRFSTIFWFLLMFDTLIFFSFRAIFIYLFLLMR